jgi:hypothetical protein
MLLFALLSAGGMTPLTAATPVTDAAVKMAIVYNFGKFVEWPAEKLAAAPHLFTICIAGPADRLQPGIAAIRTKTVKGRELRIHTLDRDEPIDGCEILFFSEMDAKRLAPLLIKAHELSILSVSDSEHFTDAGGIVELTTTNNRVQFSVNLQAARTANLRISSELLRLARTVTGLEHN